MEENIVHINGRKKQKANELESLVPNTFKNLQEFLSYCGAHSKTERALFSINHISALYKMAGYPKGNLPKERPGAGLGNFYPVYSEQMNEILDIIDRRRNSIDVKFERVE